MTKDMHNDIDKHGTYRESNDPFCGHLKMIWARQRCWCKDDKEMVTCQQTRKLDDRDGCEHDKIVDKENIVGISRRSHGHAK